MTSEHSARLIHFPEDAEPAAFVAVCSCGTASLPFPARDEAMRWAIDHGATVTDDVEVVSEEGGVGWGCMFCGSVIEEAPLRISVHWTEDGADDEQWFAAHRACLVERMSRDERFAPNFAR